jgi:hypothetical protein
MGRLRARPVRWVVTLLCGIWLMGLPRIQASSDGLVLLANNLARGIAHKWVMERCPIQEGMFMDLYPIVVAEKGKGVRTPAWGVGRLRRATPPHPQGLIWLNHRGSGGAHNRPHLSLASVSKFGVCRARRRGSGTQDGEG